MKTTMRLILTLCLFSLLGMFNAAFASKVYVLGDPTQFPERHKKLPVRIKVVDRPTYGQLLIKIDQRSSMKGYTTNYPLDDSGNKTDMLLLKSDNSGWTDLGSGVLKYEWSSYTGSTTFEKTVYVRCYDYGAWGKLKATLYKKTGTDTNGNPTYAKADSDIGTVPRDENGNHIADGWNNDFYPYKYSDEKNEQVDESSTKNSGVNNFHYSKPFLGKRQNTVDKETGPSGNQENGDGFTVFEEYRGFMTQQYGGYGGGAMGHTRTSPDTKDVFCVVHSSLSTYGTGDASKHPPSFTEIHLICVNKPFGEVRDASTHGSKSFVSKKIGWINSNSDEIPDTDYVYAIRLKDGNRHPTDATDEYTLGLSYVGKPDKQSLVYIYMDAITYAQPRYLTKYTLKQITDFVIGHEVGHTVNLKHCPQSCLDGASTCMMDPAAGAYSIGASPSSYHYIDYDLAGSVKSPQSSAGKSRGDKKENDKKKKAKPTRTIYSSSGSYTAEAGDSHTAYYSTSSPYKSVYWYVKSPSETGLGTSKEIDKGDGSTTTASFSYTFPSGNSGDYKITAYMYDSDSDSSVYEDSYTVSVSLPTTTTETDTPTEDTTPTVSVKAPVLTFSPKVSGIASAYRPGDTATATVSTGGLPIYGVWVIAYNPWPIPKTTKYFAGSKGTTALSISSPIPAKATAGQSYTWALRVYPWSGDTYGTYVKLSPTITIK